MAIGVKFIVLKEGTMIADILKSLKELQYQTLLLVFGVIFIVLSSCDIKSGSLLPHPSDRLLVIGIVLIILSFVLFIYSAKKEAIRRNGGKSMPQSLCYRCYGLKETRRASDDNVFQDFKINDSNPNAVQFLWADVYRHNIINGEIFSENIPWLRVRFDHKGGYGCNIAIRPKEWKALCNDGNYRYLTFDARIPAEEIEKDSNLLKNICIAVRIVNGYFQHWEYAVSPKEYKLLDVDTTEWGGQFRIDLTKKEWWHSFSDSDGNPDGPKVADFSIIASIILKFGKRPTPNGRRVLDPGKGVIDIRELRLI